jgi:enoyl-CoA hydratase/carnithine racemase
VTETTGVRVEREGPVTVVTIDRPERRNAVDGPAAAALADAFREFDRFGVPLIDLGTVRLPRLVGHGRAMDLLLTGRPVGAAEALAMGLVNRVVPDGTALAAGFAAGQGRHGAALPPNPGPETP